jgi:hypothetical protein
MAIAPFDVQVFGRRAGDLIARAATTPIDQNGANEIRPRGRAGQVTRPRSGGAQAMHLGRPRAGVRLRHAQLRGRWHGERKAASAGDTARPLSNNTDFT